MARQQPQDLGYAFASDVSFGPPQLWECSGRGPTPTYSLDEMYYSHCGHTVRFQKKFPLVHFETSDRQEPETRKGVV